MEPANERIPTARAACAAGVRSGREKGVQLWASLRGEACANLALGESRTGVAMSADSVLLWISMSKPVMGVAFGQLIERGLVDLDDRVAKHLPEFARGGKDDITLRHLLTHTAGFRAAWREWIAPPFDEVVATICAAPQEEGWKPGASCGYNVAAAWYVLGAVLQRVDGRDYASYARQEVFEPLRMDDCSIALSPERFRAYGERVGVMPFLENGEWKDDPSWGTEAGCAVVRPGGNGHGPMRQLARLFEMFLGEGTLDGRQVLRPETVALISQRHTKGLFDQTFGGIYDRGLGVVLDSGQYEKGSRWFGPHASPGSFGHQGFFSSVSFCDPEADLAVALVFHGVRADPEHDRRVDAVLGALYVDLGLA
ncbi:MAG: beta-lactamase family protein [Deltaproteobacteria bacterium]|nr:beta-lactamase family protein [Deltaproteobacteria bacterium]MBW2413771.1 beta-lactamase family protein [Deltaproteobacteria bacterium]